MMFVKVPIAILIVNVNHTIHAHDWYIIAHENNHTIFCEFKLFAVPEVHSNRMRSEYKEYKLYILSCLAAYDRFATPQIWSAI